MTAAWKSPPWRSALSTGRGEFCLQGFNRFQRQRIHAAQGREVEADVVSQIQCAEHSTQEGRAIVVDFLDLRPLRHQGCRDVELPFQLGWLVGISENDWTIRPSTRVLDPADELVMVRLRKARGEGELLRVLVQLRLPSSRDCGEGRRRIEDRDRGLEAEREGFR